MAHLNATQLARFLDECALIGASPKVVYVGKATLDDQAVHTGDDPLKFFNDRGVRVVVTKRAPYGEYLFYDD